MYFPCKMSLRMTPPSSPSHFFHSQISIFAVLPFSPFYHSQMLYRVHRTALANNRPSGFPERTPLKVSTISRDNHPTAANSLMHMCTHQRICIGLFTGMYTCMCTNKYTHGRASARKGEREKRENRKGISLLFTRNAPRSLFTLHAFLCSKLQSVQYKARFTLK